jgi:hypothetical protein
MGLLTEFLYGVPGYFREHSEENFPWESTSRAIWYAILNVEGNEIQRYGFTSALSQKDALVKALRKVKGKNKAILLGVWNGNHRTDLFVLDKEIAIEKLQAVLKEEA